MEDTPKREDPRIVELKSLHQIWLQDPVTRAFMDRLDGHYAHIAATIATHAMNANVGDGTVRGLAHQLATIRTIKTYANDTEKFIQTV